MHGVPEEIGVHGMLRMPRVFWAIGMHGVPRVHDVPEVLGMLGVPKVPGVLGMLGVPGMLRGAQSAWDSLGVLEVLGVPRVHGVHGVFGVPGMLRVLGMLRGCWLGRYLGCSGLLRCSRCPGFLGCPAPRQHQGVLMLTLGC